MERTGERTHERALPRRFLRAGRGRGGGEPPPQPPRPAPPPPLSSSATKSLTDADHFGMIRTAQRRFAPTVIGITRNSDRHQIGMSDRHRRNTHKQRISAEHVCGKTAGIERNSLDLRDCAGREKHLVRQSLAPLPRSPLKPTPATPFLTWERPSGLGWASSLTDKLTPNKPLTWTLGLLSFQNGTSSSVIP